MAYRPQVSFSAGELDPVFYDHTDLDKFRSGLATLRNAYVGKSGRIISRDGTQFYFSPKFPTKKSVIYAPPYSNYLVEWGDRYVRIYNTSILYINGLQGQVHTEASHPFLESDVPNLHFVPAGKNYLYIFCTGKPVQKLYLPNDGSVPTFATTASIFTLPVAPTATGGGIIGGNGYQVDYAVTYIIDGLESDYLLLTGTSILLPVSAGQTNSFGIILPNLFAGDYSHYSSINFYRRPANGNAFGFVGSAPAVPTSTGGSAPPAGTTTMIDYGGDADYTHSPPASVPISVPITAHDNPITRVTSKTGAIHQQRLLVTDDLSTEAIYGSRTDYQNSFFEESTLTSDSAIIFKAGTSGSANVLRLYDSVYGLLVFTTIGVFQNIGALDYTNLSLSKISELVIQDNVPPLSVPGGLLVVDKATNSIQSFIYSYVEQTVPPDEVSIFSNHLFQGKTVVSWAFQDGSIPLIWIVMSDGSLVSLTYQREQQMRAWAHHDSAGGLFESVTVVRNLANQSIVYFQVVRKGSRSVESMKPRTSYDLKNVLCMDSASVFNAQVNLAVSGLNPPNASASSTGSATFTIIAQDLTNWNGLLNLTSDTNGVFVPILPANQAANTMGVQYINFMFSALVPQFFYVFVTSDGKTALPNQVMRFFDTQGSIVDLTIVTINADGSLVLQPSVEFPSDQGIGPILYQTWQTMTGMTQLEGRKVSVLVDGYVQGSPNNDQEKYDTYIVTNGQITLNNGQRGAFVQVGLPFISDVLTLSVDTVEQKPTMLESVIASRAYVRVINSRGLYIGSLMPNDNSLEGLTDAETMQEDPDLGIMGNQPQAAYAKRIDMVIRNDYKSHGSIAIRQVDPLPFEILSIIPDMQVLSP